jgi:hypothetical protein
VLRDFTRRAFRRPADELTLTQLVALAERVYQQPDKTFEEGIAEAIVAILASPRFLFRLEAIGSSGPGEMHPLVDEHSLASRLSYFLWSTMPDAELLRLADEGELRENLAAQVARMVKNPRSGEFAQNFAGQWLRARDVETVAINARAVLRRGRGRGRRTGFGGPRFEFDGPLRQAMRRETEMLFEHILREDRSVLELIDSDYTFLNERLASLYGIPDIPGNEMRRVALPEGSPRGGVLTQATMLTVTSNPTRTSPVKRGLFILDNILGTPAPPAPGGVPELEEAAKQFEDREPTLREVLERHRQDALCASCHARMDPLGIALENFNALGMSRESENDQPIDASGELITGESFQYIRALKTINKTAHRSEYYRC